jgi:hypothetical protein
LSESAPAAFAADDESSILLGGCSMEQIGRRPPEVELLRNVGTVDACGDVAAVRAAGLDDKYGALMVVVVVVVVDDDERVVSVANAAVGLTKPEVLLGVLVGLGLSENDAIDDRATKPSNSASRDAELEALGVVTVVTVVWVGDDDDLVVVVVVASYGCNDGHDEWSVLMRRGAAVASRETAAYVEGFCCAAATGCCRCCCCCCCCCEYF